MLKIVYVHNSLELGGAQAVRYMFLKHFPKNGFDIRICCLGRKGEFGRKIEQLGYRVDALNKRFERFNIGATLTLYRYLKDISPDIVHSSLFYANYHSALACLFLKLPLIAEEHGEHFFHLRRKYIIFRLLGSMMAKLSNFILCCSDTMKQEITSLYGVPGRKIIVLRNMVEDKKMEIGYSKEQMRKRLGIPEDAFVFGTVSSLSIVKNQKVLIKAIALLRKYGKNIFLILTGNGPLSSELKYYASNLNVNKWIRFTGAREDVADILNSFDLFALPSLSEGMPISLLEAMSMGLPCVAAYTGGIKEIISNRINGILLANNNAEEWAECINSFMDKPEDLKALGQAARNFVLEEFRPADYVNAIIKLYSGYFTRFGKI